MKRYMTAAIAAVSVLVFQPVEVQGLGVDVGPFSFSLGGSVRVGTPSFQFYNDPICQAIHDRDLIAIYTESDNQVNRVIIEPYALGYNKDGGLVLQGYQVEAFSVDKEVENDSDDKGVVGGVFKVFKGDNWTDLSINRVVRIEVLQNTNYVVREDALKNMNESDQIVDVICSIY